MVGAMLGLLVITLAIVGVSIGDQIGSVVRSVWSVRDELQALKNQLNKRR